MKKFVFLFEICLIIFLSLVIFSAVASADHGLGVNSITGVREAGEPAATQRVNGAQMSSRGIKIEDGRVVVENDRGGKGEIFSGGEPGGQSGACQEERGNSPTEGATCNVTCPPDSKISSNNSEQFVQVASHVNLFTRQYQDENVDLSVKSAGGYIKIYRIYINGKWQFEHEYNSLGVSTAQAGNIQKSGLTYRKGKDGLFHYKSFFIRPVGERYRWENKAGNYVLFSRKGRMLETGNGFGILARYKYENDRLVSIDDRSNSPIYHFHYGANDKVNRISDQHGRDVFYKWEAEKLLEVTDVLGNSLRYGYSSTAQLINKKDDAGRELLITYHAGGAVRDVLSRKGGGFSFSYKQIKEQNEYYAKVTSAMGNVMEYWFDTSGETKKIVENDHVIREDTWGDDQLTSSDELGSRTIKTYDLYGNLRKVEFADGSTIRHIYDEKNNLVSTKNEMGVITRYSYNAQGMVWKLWAAHGTDDEVVTEYQYDPKGNLITSTVAGEKENVVTRFIYDESDNLVKIIDPMGSERIFEYDYMGNVVKVTNPAGLSSIMVYDLKGRLLKTRYPDGQSLTSVYDAADRLVSETDVEGNTTHYSYDSQDNLVKIKDPLGGVSRYSFDNDNRLTKKIDEEGKYHVFFYVGGSDLINKVVDGNNNQINITYRSFDNCGHCPTTYSQKPVRIEFPTFIRQFTYDNRGRLKEKSDLLGTTFYTEKYLYDKAGRLITSIDKTGSAIHREYDNLNRVVSIRNSASGTSRFIYDRLGNLIELIDAKEKSTKFKYDLLGRKTAEIRPQGSLLEYEYDPAGRLLHRRDSKGQEISYVYNSSTGYLDGYLLKKNMNDFRGENVQFSYDQKGRLVGYDDGVTVGSYEYDALGQCLSSSVDYKKFVSRHSYTYYKNGFKKTYTGPDGLVHFYRYTAINTLEEVNIYGVGSIGFDSYKWLRPERITSPGIEKMDSVDNFLRLSARKTRAGGKIILDLGYRYNGSDNIVRWRSGERVTGYSYDRLQQLVGVQKEGKSTETYMYDPAGNMLLGTNGREYRYDEMDQLVAVDDTTYKYDIDGNTVERKTKDGTTKFRYNFENRIASIEKNGIKMKYYYDPFGRRLLKDVNGKRTWFAYSEEGLVAEFKDNGELLASYTWQPDGLWSTDPILLSKNDKHYFYHNDHLGTPQTLTDTEGNIVWLASYNAFGEVEIEKEEVGNNLRLPGQYYDKETGLYYNWHRYYEPKTGRYLSADPIGFDGGLNLFSYVGGNPVNWVDPWGLSSVVAGKTYVPGAHWEPSVLARHEAHDNDNRKNSFYGSDQNGVAGGESSPKSLQSDYDAIGKWHENDGLLKPEKNVTQHWLLEPNNENPINSTHCEDFTGGAVEKDYDRLTGGWVAALRGKRESSGARYRFLRP